jgi:hypothetical protein
MSTETQPDEAVERLRSELSVLLTKNPEGLDTGAWYDRQRWRADVLRVRIAIAEAEGAGYWELQKLRDEYEEARNVGD